MIKFWRWSSFACGFWITFHFLHHCWIGDFWRFISIYHKITGWFVPYLAKKTDADNIMNPQHFGTDSSDIRITLAIRNPDSNPRLLWLNFWHWQRFVLSEWSCCYEIQIHLCCVLPELCRCLIVVRLGCKLRQRLTTDDTSQCSPNSWRNKPPPPTTVHTAGHRQTDKRTDNQMDITVA